MSIMSAGQGRSSNQPAHSGRSPVAISIALCANASIRPDEGSTILPRSSMWFARVSYHSGTRCVSVELRDGSQFDYFLPVPVRPGVQRREGDANDPGRTPRISRLLALAHRFEALLANGTVQTYRELAELGHVSRPRLSQMMKLAQLAPDIQEQLLFLPPSVRGADLVFERHLRSIADVMDWDAPAKIFRSLSQQSAGDPSTEQFSS